MDDLQHHQPEEEPWSSSSASWVEVELAIWKKTSHQPGHLGRGSCHHPKQQEILKAPVVESENLAGGGGEGGGAPAAAAGGAFLFLGVEVVLGPLEDLDEDLDPVLDFEGLGAAEVDITGAEDVEVDITAATALVTAAKARIFCSTATVMGVGGPLKL